MTPGYTLHTGDEQPRETINKKVRYRLFNSDRYGAHWANLINWSVNGPSAPKIGRIFEYQVIE